jgi:2-keto-4-pentenoate hydratase
MGERGQTLAPRECLSARHFRCQEDVAFAVAAVGSRANGRKGARRGAVKSGQQGDVDPRLAAALVAQLERRRAALHRGAEPIGWKLGQGERERIGGEIAVGHLTSETCLPAGAVYVPDDPTAELHADAELAVELRHDLGPGLDVVAARRAIGAYAVALEIVDLKRPPDDPESVVASNDFHRAVAFGPSRPRMPTEAVTARLLVNGETRAAAEADADVAPRLCAAARVLDAVGERLRAGDRIITGLVINVPLTPGDEVIADMGRLGRVGLSIGA